MKGIESLASEIRKLYSDMEQIKAQAATIMQDSRSMSQQVEGKATMTVQALEAKQQTNFSELTAEIGTLRRQIDGTFDQVQSQLWNKTEGALALRTAKEDQIQNSLEMKIMALERTIKDERDSRRAFEEKLQIQFSERLEQACKETKQIAEREHEYNKTTRHELAQGMQAATETLKALEADGSVKRDDLEQRIEVKIRRILQSMIT